MPTETDIQTPTAATETDTGAPARRRLAGTAQTARRRRAGRRDGSRDDRGQATSEYGLVILVAAGIAFGVIAWAGNTEAFTNLFDAVVDRLTSGL